MVQLKKIGIIILTLFIACGCAKSKGTSSLKDDFINVMTMNGYKAQEQTGMQIPMIDDGILQEGDDGYEYLVQEPIEHIDNIYYAEKNDESGTHMIYYVIFDDGQYAYRIYRKVTTKYISKIQENDHETNLLKDIAENECFTIAAFAFDEEMSEQYGSYCAAVGLDNENNSLVFAYLVPEKMNEGIVSKNTPTEQIKIIVEELKKMGLKETEKIK